MNLFWFCYLRSLPSLDRRYRALCDRAALHGFAWLRQAPSRGFGAVPSCSGHCRLLYLHRLLRVDVFQFWLGWQLGANSTICWAHLILNLRLQNSSQRWKRGNFASLCGLCQDKPCTIFCGVDLQDLYLPASSLVKIDCKMWRRVRGLGERRPASIYVFQYLFFFQSSH